MQLNVETGNGLHNSNSYIDFIDIDEYLSSSVLEKWNALTDDEKIDRMITASSFIDYSFNWIGQQKTLEQGLCWPRINVLFQNHLMPDNYVPNRIKRACVMALVLIIEHGLFVFQETGESEVKKEKIGPMETEYFESLKTHSINNSQYSDINNMLRGLFNTPQKSSIISVPLERR